MWDSPRKCFDALIELAEPLDSLTLHAVLHRVCRHHVATIYNHWREPTWGKFVADAASRALAVSERFPRSWVRAMSDLLRAAPGDSSEKTLMTAAALLQALDHRHREQRTMLERTIHPLPRPFHGSTAFLWPPANPISDRVPQAKRLRVAGKDLGHDLDAMLGLECQLLELEQHRVEPRFRELDAALSAELASRFAREGDLVIGLASPFAALAYEIQADPERRHPQRGVPYHFVRLAPEHLGIAKQDLDLILEHCALRHVDVLCFPELTLDDELLQHLRERLKHGNASRHPALVMTGSFHLRGDSCWVNRCHLLDGRGRDLYEQEKCVAYGILPEDAAEMSQGLIATLGINAAGGYEDIGVSRVVNVIDSPLGRLATPICLDFCGTELDRLLIESRVNLLLVPAMTPGMGRFRQRATVLGDHCRGSCFVVNSAWLLRQLGQIPQDEGLLLAYLPMKARQAPQAEGISKDLWMFSIRVLLTRG